MDFKVLLERITPALKAIARRNLLYGFYSEDDLYQEMCLYLWKTYSNGLPIGINEGYAIKGCEFHLKNFLRKGRPKAKLTSIDAPIGLSGQTLADTLEDKSQDLALRIDEDLTIDEIKSIGLTEKEEKVFNYLLRGLTVREIAKEMDVSHVMVLKHKKNIIKKWKRKGYQR